MGHLHAFRKEILCMLLVVAFLTTNTSAGLVMVTVSIRNLAPTNSVSFAPLRLGFGNGSFDAFDSGTTAGSAIVSIAEGGSGSDWFPAFQAADPTSVRGSVGGALLPGMTASNTFMVDNMTVNNRFFTFATMVIPSNDLFLGNDNPTEHQLFDASGNLLISSITQTAGEIWDANSEVADPANAAFVVGGTNSLRTPENGLIAFDRTELDAFNGLTTAAGYTFDSGLLLDNADGVYEISFSVSAVPEPTSLVLGSMAFGGFGIARYRKWKANKTKNAQLEMSC